MFDIVDVSDWVVVAQEPVGNDLKDWITHPEHATDPQPDQLWLYKSFQTGSTSGYRRYDDLAERLASALAKAIGLPAARVEFAKRGDSGGIISQNVRPKDCDLINANSILTECPGYVSCDSDPPPKERPGHNLANVETVLDGCGGPPGPFAEDPAFSVFAGYLVFDAWIANTDRHALNWAVLDKEGQQRRLAPSFDHGTALGSGIAERYLPSMNPIKFASRGKATRFEGGRTITLVDLALRAVELGGPRAHGWLERVACFDPARIDVLVSAATNAMKLSDQRRTFVAAVLRENQRRLTT